MQLTHDIIYYFGMSFGILAIIGLWYFWYITKKKANTLSVTESLKSNLLLISGTTLLMILSFVFFDIAFFIDPAQTKYLAANNITLNAGRQFLSYFFIIINAIGICGLTYGLTYYAYYREKCSQVKLISTLVWAISIPTIAISFILWMEGNAPYFIYPLANTLHIGKEGIIIINNVNSGISGGFNIAFYAIAILTGACIVLIITDHISYKRYGHHGLLTTCFLIAVPCGIIGARLWYVVLDITRHGMASDFIKDPVEIFRMWHGGLGIMGGAILGIIGGVTTMIVLVYVMKKPQYKGMKLLHIVDYIVPCILVAQAVGRWGNFFNNEVFGFQVKESTFAFLPTWIRNNMKFEFGDLNRTADPGNIFLPLFFIEGCTNLIGYFFIYYGFCRPNISRLIIKGINACGPKDRRLIQADEYHAHGSCAGMYIMWYGVTRIVLEPLRNGSDMFQASIWSAYGMLIGGAVLVIYFILFHEIYTKRIKVQKDALKQLEVEAAADGIDLNNVVEETSEEPQENKEIEEENKINLKK